MTIYCSKIKNWPIELDAKSLKSLKNLAKKIAKENGIDDIELISVEKYTEKREKLKNVKLCVK